jgi:hypothetical protein
MPLAAFIVAVIGIGLLCLGNSVGQDTFEHHQAAGLFLVFPGFMLLFFGAIIWVRLTILGWIIRFAAHNWQAGKAQYIQGCYGRPRTSKCTRQL